MIKDILIPIDLGIHTEFAVKQAIELSKATGATIHLLHIINSGNSWSHFISNKEMADNDNGHGKELVRKLEQWKLCIEETVAGSSVSVHLMKGVVHDCIIEAAKKIGSQLIILGKTGQKKFFRTFRPLCPNEISKLSNCPVLSIMDNTVSNRMQNIVVPVRSFIPKRKIELLLIFAQMYRAKIHLLALLSKMGETDAERTALLDTYGLLKRRLNNPIEYHLLRGDNLPRSTLKYAEEINADMIFVNPCAETKTSSFFGKHINELLPTTSKLKFLFVEPYSEKAEILRVK